MEGILRLSSFGYPTSFFLRRQINGQSLFVENDRFGWSFFPRTSARTPSSIACRTPKPKDTFRVAIMGESAAMGYPNPYLGFAHLLEVLLQEQNPHVRVEVVNTAVTALNSHALIPIANELSKIEPDAIILYIGNNEVVGPYGPGTVFSPAQNFRFLIRLHIALKRWRLVQWSERLLASALGHRGPTQWQALSMFQKNAVELSDPRLQKVYEYYRRNMSDILEASRQTGAQVLLCTIGTNLRDFAPLGSAHGKALSSADTETWDRLYQAGLEHQKQRRWQRALAAFDQAAEHDPFHADLQFQRGRCLLALSQTALAREAFVRARDLDTLRFRADSQINDILRDLGAQGSKQGVHFLDLEQKLSKKSPQGIPGNNFFLEHVHPTFEGHYEIAIEMAKALQSVSASTSSWLSRGMCAQRIAYDSIAELEVVQNTMLLVNGPPFTSQSNHAERLVTLRSREALLQRAASSFAVRQALFLSALRHRPYDPMIRTNHAEFLVSEKRYDLAIREHEHLRDQFPLDARTWMRLGYAQLAKGDAVAAVGTFKQYRSLQPYNPHPYVALADAYGKMGDTKQALAFGREALRLDPSYTLAYSSLIRTLLKAGLRTEVIVETLGPSKTVSPSEILAMIEGIRKRERLNDR